MPPHSEDYFGSERDFWWNDDFLALIARRCQLDGVRRVLDVGCGVGHWTRALAPHLPDAAVIDGIDREAEWVTRAQAAADSAGLSQRAHFTRGAAEAIPFADGTFDLVTCQTVLIHVADCAAVLREMRRVLAPDGRLLLAEPNNLAASLVATSSSGTLDQRLSLTRFQALCERGKSLLGEGDNSVGDLLPGLAAQCGFVDVRVWISDRASELVPPYADAAQRAIVREARDFTARDLWIWNRSDTHRYFLAGGGDDAEFDPLWQLAILSSANTARDVAAGTHHTAGGNLTYVIFARK